MRQRSTFKIAVVANLAALSTLLYFFIKFPLPFLFPAFLDIQFSNLPAILGGYMFGPIAGNLIVLVRFAVKIWFSTTAGVGELQDLIIGVSVVSVSSLIYMKNRTMKGAVLSSLAGIATWVVVASVTNYFFIVPFYLQLFFGGNVQALLSMLQIIPGINEDNYLWYFVLYASIPFNILLSIIVFSLTFLVYKRLREFIEWAYEKSTRDKKRFKTVVVQPDSSPTKWIRFKWGLFGFVLPYVGLILYLVWRSERPQIANDIIMGAFAGVIVHLAVLSYLIKFVF